MDGFVVEPSQVCRHRLRVNHLAARMPAGSPTATAFAGLQDSAPRTALTALYSRVEDVGSSDWEHPSLVQTWAPRGAVFVVPRSDLAVFALGIVPRDAQLRRALEQLASRARDSILEPRKDDGRRERDRLGPLPPVVAERMRRRPVWRLVCALAGVQIRWDARSTQLLRGPALAMDEEEAGRELARRFLRSLGPQRAGTIQPLGRSRQHRRRGHVRRDRPRARASPVDGRLGLRPRRGCRAPRARPARRGGQVRRVRRRSRLRQAEAARS